MCNYMTNAEVLTKIIRFEEENATLRLQLADVTESIGRVEKRCAELRKLVLEIYEDQCCDGDKWRYKDRMCELGIGVDDEG